MDKRAIESIIEIVSRIEFFELAFRNSIKDPEEKFLTKKDIQTLKHILRILEKASSKIKNIMLDVKIN